MKELKVTSKSDLLKVEKRLTDIRAKARSVLQRVSANEAKKHLNDLIGAIDGHLGEIAKAKTPTKTSYVPESTAGQCLSTAMIVLQQMNKEGYLSSAQKDLYRSVAEALRQQADTLDSGLNYSDDPQSLKMARQVIAQIEAKL